MQPIYDNIDFFGANRWLKSSDARGAGSNAGLRNQGLLQIKPLTHIRGSLGFRSNT